MEFTRNITTNRIVLEINDNFYKKFSVLSYRSEKNIAYERLSCIPVVSVAGINSRWGSVRSYTRFFILVNKGDEFKVLFELQEMDDIKSKIDDEDDYTEKDWHRIVANLAINALGYNPSGKRMIYNNGSLIISDPKNFLFEFGDNARQELVCLKVEINRYMNLMAKTLTLHHPHSYKELMENVCNVFKVCHIPIDGLPNGLSVNPVVVKITENKKFNLDDVYIIGKEYEAFHNIVPYWPYDASNYRHGKLFAIMDVLRSTNEKFNDCLKFGFVDVPCLYDEYGSSSIEAKESINKIKSFYENRRAYVIDPFQTELSREYIEKMKSAFSQILGHPFLSSKRGSYEFVLKLCKDLDIDNTFTYSKSFERMSFEGISLQHVIFNENGKDNSFPPAEARRILLEFFVKHCIEKNKMPDFLSTMCQGWEFFKYKIREGFIYGASMNVNEDNKIEMRDIGIEKPVDFEIFCQTILSYNEPLKIKGYKDYFAAKKDGNVYLFVDTEEVPLLDTDAIDEKYSDVKKGLVSSSSFKNKKDNSRHKYFGGYIGFHLWKSEGIDGKESSSYSYFSGTNSQHIRMDKGNMDRMPRARRIFVLHSGNKEVVEQHIKEFTDMLKSDYGRWGEMMTYPFPSKYLKEYLDKLCETRSSIHWENFKNKSKRT